MAVTKLKETEFHTVLEVKSEYTELTVATYFQATSEITITLSKYEDRQIIKPPSAEDPAEICLTVEQAESLIEALTHLINQKKSV